MAIKLNLLPPEYEASKGLGSLLKAVKALGVITTAGFFIFTLGLSAFYIFTSLTLDTLNSDIDALKGQIGAEEKTEQQIVLLKDRLTKIKTVLGLPSINKNLEAIGPYVFDSSVGTLTEMSVDPQKVDYSVAFPSADNLASFLGKLSEDKTFGSITLMSFTYNPATGYQGGFRATKK